MPATIAMFRDGGKRVPAPICACGRETDAIFVQPFESADFGGVDGWRWHIGKCFRCRVPAPKCECGAEVDRLIEEGASTGVEWASSCSTCLDFRGHAYVNAYAVTRHCGGGEEGGWWFDAGEPLGAIPVRAKVALGRVVPEDQGEVASAEAILRAVLAHHERGDIYSVRGGVRLDLIFEDHFARSWSDSTPRYE